MPIGIVPIAISKASLSERSEKSRLPMADTPDVGRAREPHKVWAEVP
jgi:hypothetical protein